MADIKVSELAKEYGKKSSEIIAEMRKLGEYASTASSTIVPPVERELRKVLGDPLPLEPPEQQSVNPEVKEVKPPKNGSATAKSTKSAKFNLNVKDFSPVVSAKPLATVDDNQDKSKVQSSEKDSPHGFVATPSDPIPTPLGIPKPRLVNTPKPSDLKRTRGNNPYLVGGGANSKLNQHSGGYQSRSGQARQLRNGGLLKPGQRPPNGVNNDRRQPLRNSTPNNNGQRKFGDGKLRQIPGIGGSMPSDKQGNQKTNQNQRSQFVRRGQTAGAHGQQKTGKAAWQEKRKRNVEQDILEMPTIHGVAVPKGDGKTVIRLRRGATLVDFGEKIGVDPANLAKILFAEFKQMITLTQSMDDDTLELLAVELGYDVEVASDEDVDRELLGEFDIDLNAESEDEVNQVIRPPVVTVMGHVDHGKTKLLDAVRNTNVIADEAGGITQRIGAYQIHLDHEGVDRKITFIDTPGHEAFTAMRARGAKVTDVAILVVAADDGVMPQTVEAINHAQSANVPIVVAVNKIDKEGANPDKVRGQLTEFNLVPEEYGGDTMFIDISAKAGTGILELLDAVLLTVDAAMELTANPNMSARGSIIEARLDKGRGPVVAALVQTGTIHIGDPIVAGRSYGKVRAMYNENGRKLKEAYPSCPVRILGLQSVPTAGDSLIVTDDERTARQIAEKRESEYRSALLAKRRKRMTLEDFKQAVEDGKVDMMNLIIKGDTSGSVEALEDALVKLEEDAILKGEVGLNVIHRGVGDITQNDVNLATVDSAIIIGFNVKPAAGMAGELADAEGVDIRYYNVIYQAIDDIELSLHGMLKPEYEESITGFAEVRQIFKSSKAGVIAGSMVKGGEIKRNASVRIFRDEKQLSDGLKIDSLKRFKDDASSVKEGFECGIGLGSWNDIEEGDIIEAYEMVEKPRELPKRS